MALVSSEPASLTDELSRRDELDERLRWLVTLREWRKQAPRLYVVPGRDGMTLIGPEQPSGILLRD